MMKKLLVFVPLTGFLIWTVLAVTNPVFSVTKISPDIPVDTLQLKKHVYQLTQTPKPRSFKNLKSLNQAADYIKTEFDKSGGRISEQKYLVNNTEYRNVICSFGPGNAPRLIIGAHYDVAGNQVGADDNASGTAGLIELARLIGKRNPELKYRVDLVAYTLEEPPYFRTEHMGSAVHAKHLAEKNIPVKAMICLEMIGYFSHEKKSQDYPVGLLKLFYPGRGNFISVVGKFGQGKIVRRVKRKMLQTCKIPVKSINAPAFIPGIDFSDHLNYWKYGFDAVMITDTAFYRNKNYHEPTDTPQTLNYKKMGEVVKGVYTSITQMP